MEYVKKNVEKVRELIRLHPSISRLEIALNLGLDHDTVRTIVNDFLHLGQINHRWTPTTLNSAQRAQRLEWSNFVLEKSKHPDRFIARFDTWIYKHIDHWTFDSNTTIMNTKHAIACFYTIAGIRAVVSMSDPRFLLSPDIVDKCFDNNVKEERYLYVDSSAYNPAGLLDCLHDRGVVLVALPECSPDLMLGEAFLEPMFWWNLQKRRFDTHDEGLKEYKYCIGNFVNIMSSKMFERWFEKIGRCSRNEGDYVEQINLNVDYYVPSRTVMVPNFLIPSQVSVNTPTPNRSTEEPTITNAAKIDGCVEWPFTEPKIELKKDEPVKFNGNEQQNIELAIASNGGSRLVTGPLMKMSTVAATSPQPIVPQQLATGFHVDGSQKLWNNGNVRTPVVTQQEQRHQAPASSEDSVSGDNGVSNVSAQQLSCTTEAASDGKVYPKPAYSYPCLCVLAIKNSPIGALPVTAIYRFICEHFPYFKTAPNGWKNSVRHNLSHNKRFEKIDTETVYHPNKRRSLWVIKPLEAEKVELVLQKKTKKHLQNIRKAMSHPENLDLLVRGEMKFVTDLSEDIEDSNDEIEIPNGTVLASQLELNSASDDNVSQDDEIDVVDDNKEALRVQVNLTSKHVSVPVAKRQKTLEGTMQAVYVYQPAKDRVIPLVYHADPSLEMIK